MARALPCPLCGAPLVEAGDGRRARCPDHRWHRPRLWRGLVRDVAILHDSRDERIWTFTVDGRPLKLRTAPGQRLVEDGRRVTLARGGERLSVRDEDTGAVQRLVHHEPSPALRSIGVTVLWVTFGLVCAAAARDTDLRAAALGVAAVGVVLGLVGTRRPRVAAAGAALLTLAFVAAIAVSFAA